MDHAAKQSDLPILLVDKEGSLGGEVAMLLIKEQVCVLVTGLAVKRKENLIVVPYKNQIPRIPNSAFAYMYLFYSGDKKLLDLLSNFVKKAKEDKSHIYFVSAIRDLTDTVAKKIADQGTLITLVIVGDSMEVLGKGNLVNHMLVAAQKGSVILPEMGETPVYPVAKEDVLGVLAAISKHKEASQMRILYALPSHPMNSMSFSRLLVKKEPLLHIDFSAKRLAPPTYTLGAYRSVFGDNYPVEEKIPDWALEEKQDEQPKSKRIRRPWPRPKLSGYKGAVIIFVVLLLVITASPVLLSAIGGGLMLRAQTNIKAGQFALARSNAVAAKQYFSLAERTDGWLVVMLTKLGQQKSLEALRWNIDTGTYLAELAIDGIDGFTALKRVLTSTSLDPKHDFQQGLNNMKFALTQLRTLQAEKRIPAQYQSQITQILQQSSALTNSLDVLPQLLGMQGKRIYLVLFQNNMELRPGGGFIGSYALITVERGKIAEMHIQDVYDADGQLRDHIEPPYPLRRYLGSQHWFLRDSNFDVDFANNAAMAGYFYNMEMGKKVDGVIAVDISFVRNLLAAIGPIPLPDYNETITATNFFTLTEAHAQNNFFAGSTQKKDFLSTVYSAIFTRLTTAHDLPYERLLAGLGQSALQKHLLFGFPDPGMQKLFSVNGLSSALADERVEKSGSVNDFFGINEANLGQNKANQYLNRAVTQRVLLRDDGTASETATIHYQNTSTATSAFGGDYKAYIRLILPVGSKLVSVTIDGHPQPTIDAVTNVALFSSQLFRPPSQLEVEQTQENGKNIWGFFLIVPKGTTKIVSVTYTLLSPRAVNTPGISYTMRLFKQPGTESDPYVLKVIYPSRYSMLGEIEGGKEQDGVVTFLSDISQDREFGFSLTKK